MPVNSTVEVVGLKQTINGLGKIDKQLQKDFKTDATQIAQPAINSAKKAYEVLGNESHPFALSGMSRNWTKDGRKIFPFRLDRAIKGVQTKFDTRKRAIGVILIIQKDVAAAVFEAAGRKTSNRLGASLGFLNKNTTRIIGPAVDKELQAVTREMSKMVLQTMQNVQKGFK